MSNQTLSPAFNLNLVSAAIAAAAGNVNLNIAVGTLAHIIDGQFYTRAANASIAWTIAENTGVQGDPGNGSFTGAVGGSVRLFGLFMDTAGALSAKGGKVSNVAKLAAGEECLEWPAPQRGKVCFGVVRIALTAATTFVPGVTALNAAGVTASYINLAHLPSEPLRA
jgi:hypothetical protein